MKKLYQYIFMNKGKENKNMGCPVKLEYYEIKKPKGLVGKIKELYGKGESCWYKIIIKMRKNNGHIYKM